MLPLCRILAELLHLKQLRVPQLMVNFNKINFILVYKKKNYKMNLIRTL